MYQIKLPKQKMMDSENQICDYHIDFDFGSIHERAA